MNKVLSALVALVLSAGCIPTGKPHTPAPSQKWTLQVCLVDKVTKQRVEGRVETDGAVPHPSAPTAGGCAQWSDFTAVGFNVNSSAEGYLPGWAPVSERVGQIVIELTAAPKPPSLPNGGEKGKLSAGVVAGRPVFLREDGTIFPWVGTDGFALFARFARGEDINPFLTEKIQLGFNVIRVFLMFDQFGIGGPQGSALGAFSPKNTPNYYPKLTEFRDLLASRGLRFEATFFADAECRSDGTGCLMPLRGEKEKHIAYATDALRGSWNVLQELCNECFKNFDEPETYTLDPSVGLRAYGTKLPDGDIPTVWKMWEYLTPHDHERKDEWPRTARGYGEIVDVLKNRVVADEPMGFADVARPGSRSTDVNDAAYFAATMQMFASGSTFHSDNGVAATLFSPTQKEAAKAWAWAARWVPPEAQLAPYQRGGDCGTGGIGDMPIEHCDLETGAPSRALRSFCKFAFGLEYCVRIRPVGPTVPRPGWVVVDEPRVGFAVLKRQ